MIDRVGKGCTGCYACKTACPKDCIHMVEDAEGFWYPEIDSSKCIKCDLCEKSCPVLNELPINKKENDIHLFAMSLKDDVIRRESSSGGAFSAIAQYVLERGGVVFGAAFDTDFSVHHICVDNVKDLKELRGSKYLQSRIEDSYKQAEGYLKSGRLVLFSGTACQTSGLVSFLKRDYDNLITQDLVCHGVPSPMAWKKYLEFRQKLERSKVTDVFFRDKSSGWHKWHLSIGFENGNRYSESQFDDLMIQTFLRGKCSRECCYDCKFKQKIRLADFTLADFWGIEHIAPELDDDAGLSECFANSEKALRIIDAIKDNINIQEMAIDPAVKYNSAMIESEVRPKDRDSFLLALKHHSFESVVAKQTGMSAGTKIRWTARRILGNRTYDAIIGKKSGRKNDT